MAEKRMYGRDLVDAIMDRNISGVRRLMKLNANTDFVLKGDKAIHLAARLGQYKTIKYLLQSGEDVDKPNTHGNTALHYAARGGREDIVRLLVDNGANLNGQNYAGETALHNCVGYLPMDIIERFVKMGMDVNMQTKTGDTPLHRAVEYSREESIEALLFCDADPYITNESGKRPDQLAKVPSIGEQIRTHSLIAAALNSGYIQSQGMKISHTDVRKPLPIERVGIVIEQMDIPSDFPITFYCRREKSENSTIKVEKSEDDQIISDVFVLRVRDVYRDVAVTLTLPLYATPTQKETLNVKFPLGNTCKFSANVIEKDENPYCKVCFVLIPETTCAIVMCASPKSEVTYVSTEETTIESELDTGFSIQIPEGAFKENTEISLKVFDVIDDEGGGSDTTCKTEDSDDVEIEKMKDDARTRITPVKHEGQSDTSMTTVDNEGHSEDLAMNGDGSHLVELQHYSQDDTTLAQSSDIILANDDNIAQKKSKRDKKKDKKKKRKREKRESNLLSDVYEIDITGEQPSKSLTLKIPLKNGFAADDDVQIVRIDEGSDSPIHVLPFDATITEDGNVVFETSHFSMYVVIPRTKLSTGPNMNLRTIHEDVINSKHKKQYARFFVMLKQLDREDTVGRHVLLVECIRAGSSKKRRSRWKKDGFEKQKPKNSRRKLLAPGQEFTVKLEGEAMFDQTTGETGSRKLVFSPFRASNQPYNIKLPPIYKHGRASVSIYPENQAHNSQQLSSDQNDNDNTPLTELKIQLHLPPEEDPFSEEIETLASYKTLAEIRHEEQKLEKLKELREEKRARKLEQAKQRIKAEKEKALQELQRELQENCLPGRPTSSHEESRFKTPEQLKIDL